MGKTKSKKISISEAKARFATCVRAAEEGGPILLTRHGEVVAALINVEDLASLQRLRSSSGGGLASLAGGWKGSDELVAAIETIDRSSTRGAPVLD